MNGEQLILNNLLCIQSERLVSDCFIRCLAGFANASIIQTILIVKLLTTIKNMKINLKKNKLSFNLKSDKPKIIA